ncbi:MAG TPA: hypothetical protein ENO22_05885 [candidate division Zixibacteria bacterium]|nr:hypothetical protein [candidate division Zixibacteria bacterium]
MKRMSFFAVLTLFLAVPVCGQDYAAEDHHYGFHFGAAYSNFQDDKLEIEIIEPDDIITFYLGGSLFFYEIFALEVSVSYAKESVYEVASGAAVNYGDFTQFPISVSAKLYNNPEGGKVRAFLAAGMSYYFLDFDQSQYLTNIYSDVYGVTGKVKVENELSPFFAIGIDIFISHNAAISSQIKYTWLNPRVTLPIPMIWDEHLKVNPFTISLGFSLYGG